LSHFLTGLLAASMLLLPVGAGAQSASDAPADTLDAPATPPPHRAPKKSDGSGPRVYWGGAVGFNFWNDYKRLSIEPLVAYKFDPKLSLGGRVRYEYLKDQRGPVDYDSHNFGASVFSRYRLVPQLYAHAEFAFMSFDYPRGREGVPFLYLGGGYSVPMGSRSWAYVEVLVDVLQDSKSPYEDWDPRVTAGVGVGF